MIFEQNMLFFFRLKSVKNNIKTLIIFFVFLELHEIVNTDFRSDLV